MKHTPENLFRAYNKRQIPMSLVDDKILADKILSDKEIESALIDCQWDELRNERNVRLAACDWTVLSDTPTSTAAWKAYRQELRDLPANTTDPFNPVWPTPPS